MYYLYWMHLDSHTNPFNEGYVGMSKNPVQRMRTHTNYKHAYSKGVRSAIAEFGKEVIKHNLLGEFSSYEEVRNAERMYRPFPNIGWNLSKGGGVTPDCSGRAHLQSSKDQIGQSNRLAYQVRGYVPSQFKGVTNRYSAETKALIGSYHKGKTISEAHRKSASEKLLGENSPKAVGISLFHKDLPTKIYTYGCIKDAAKAHGVNYSTLRSAHRLNRSSPNKQGWCIQWD